MSDRDSSQDEVARLKAGMLQKLFFVMRRRIVNAERLPAVMLDHYRWIIDLEKRGLVFASGPVFERDGSPGVGMTVFKVATIEEAEQLAAGDPFCQCGAAEFDVVSWQVNEGRITLSVDFSDQSFSIC